MKTYIVRVKDDIAHRIDFDDLYYWIVTHAPDEFRNSDFKVMKIGTDSNGLDIIAVTVNTPSYHTRLEFSVNNVLRYANSMKYQQIYNVKRTNLNTNRSTNLYNNTLGAIFNLIKHEKPTFYKANK